MLIDDLASRLLDLFPASDAEPWDHVGLSVGRPDDEVAKVALALDANVDSIRAAAELGANVLLTHHPVYIKAPSAFLASTNRLPASSRAVFEAIERRVSIISLHTNLDRSHAARMRISHVMGLSPLTSLEFPDDPARPGLGAIAEMPGLPLDEVVERAAGGFGSCPRVWGDPDRTVRRIGLLGGSVGDLGELAIAAGVDVLVCGEAGYHVCQDLSLRGCDVILLGHDRSEAPFVDILRDSTMRAGIDGEHIVTIGCLDQWWTHTKGERS
ncbi:MAG: Nif3-like dinuclear metal center hexameric protein [Collinsella sp.]|nr:Nif3-like dinuclear metal center hexameric protein [Collinsella sp.]